VNAQQTVIGQNNPAVDVQAVQAAVSQGGDILLKGTFDFGKEGRVNITKDVKILGETGLVTKIKGGFWNFHSPLPAKLPPEVPGPKITIQGIHFDGALWSPICLCYSSGATISNNKMTNIKPRPLDEPIFGQSGINSQQGIICYPGFGQPTQSRKYIPNIITGNVIIEDNDIDMINESPAKTMAQGVFVLWTTGIVAKIQRNTIMNCSRNSIEAIDNYLGQDGSGMILIRDNKITTPQVGVPLPTPNTPNGIVAGWFFDMTGGTDPKRNPKYIIINNFIKAQGQMSAGIATLSDGVLMEDNAVVTDGSEAVPIFLAGGNGFIAHNKIEGTGIYGIMAMPWGPLKASNNFYVDNDFTRFKASGAEILFQKGVNNNLLLGNSGAVSDLGSGNQITGLKTVTK
jgi:hypothetical protein